MGAGEGSPRGGRYGCGSASPAMSTKDGSRVCVAAIRLEDVAALQLAQRLGKMCPSRGPPAKSACLEGPILEAHIGTLHSPAVSHLLFVS